MKKRPFDLHQQLSELKYDLLEEGPNIEYFHAAEDKQAVRNRVFALIAKSLDSLRIDTLVVEKSKIESPLQTIERFYPEMLGRLLRILFTSQRADLHDDVIIVTDSIPVKRQRRAVEKAVKKTLSRNLPEGLRYRMLHHASKSNFGLQIADYCNWAIFRKWERNDTRSYDLIKDALKSELHQYYEGGFSDSPKK